MRVLAAVAALFWTFIVNAIPASVDAHRDFYVCGGPRRNDVIETVVCSMHCRRIENTLISNSSGYKHVSSGITKEIDTGVSSPFVKVGVVSADDLLTASIARNFCRPFVISKKFGLSVARYIYFNSRRLSGISYGDSNDYLTWIDFGYRNPGGQIGPEADAGIVLRDGIRRIGGAHGILRDIDGFHRIVVGAGGVDLPISFHVLSEIGEAASLAITMRASSQVRSGLSDVRMISSAVLAQWPRLAW